MRMLGGWMAAVTLAGGAAAAAAGCARLSAPGPAANTTHAFVPTPASVETQPGGDFVVTPATVIVAPVTSEAAVKVGRYLSSLIGRAAGPEPPAVVASGASVPSSAIQLRLGAVEGGDEAYTLEIAAGGVTITANTAAGLFYGVQTFRQALPPFVEYRALSADKTLAVKASPVRVVDRPRFVWRGAMLDVARHFFSVDDVKRFIDLIALYKFNRLHLHLADDQGWRIEIKSRPNLTTRGSLTEVGGGAGGFYTQAQYADLVSYAADRFITIVPEIDMPGHTNAALASYAELNCDRVLRQPYTGVDVGFSALCVDNPATFAFIDDVVREIAAMTPGPYFHIGGDEVKTLTPAQYGQFIEHVQQIVRAHGKQMIGWDEISPVTLDPTTRVQYWRPDGSPAAAVAQGAKVIMSPANRTYLDMKYRHDTPIGQDWAGLIDVQAAYAWDPATLAKDVPASAIAGVEAAVWTETLATMQDVEYMLFPRLPAVADVAWAQPGGRDWNQFKTRLGAQAPRWSVLGVNFYRSPVVPWQ
jgi:N-acetyl-beta-hexosaminidase